MNKKIVALASVAMLAVSVLGTAIPTATAAPKKQEVEGTILFPARHPNGCYTGLQRHLISLFGEASNGVLGWGFRVDKKTWNKNFVLEGTGVGHVDLDITFYLGEFVSREEWIANPAPGAPATVGFEEHDQPGEAGKVPKGTIWALVCIYANEAATPPSAVAVDFVYTAGKGVKIPK